MTSRDDVVERILANAGLEGILDEREIGLILDNLQPGDEIGGDKHVLDQEYLEERLALVDWQSAAEMRERCAKEADNIAKVIRALPLPGEKGE